MWGWGEIEEGYNLEIVPGQDVREMSSSSEGPAPRTKVWFQDERANHHSNNIYEQRQGRENLQSGCPRMSILGEAGVDQLVHSPDECKVLPHSWM